MKRKLKMPYRETYKNGDPVILKQSGCDGCSPNVIQGLFCHELNCPDAWRDDSPNLNKVYDELKEKGFKNPKQSKKFKKL